LFALVDFTMLDSLLDLLGFALVHDEHSIGCFNDDNVFKANHGNQPIFGADVAILGISNVNITTGDITIRILRGNTPQRIPGTDIAPGELCGDDSGTISVLHDGIINGIRWTGGKCALTGADKTNICCFFLPGLLYGNENVWSVLPQFLQVM